MDAVILSDIHLGSTNCLVDEVNCFLDKIKHREIITKRLIVNGDLFDNIDFRRMKKKHWKVLSELRSMSDEIEVVWVKGNHDEAADVISHLLGIRTCEKYIFSSGEKRILVFHGDKHDKFISDHPFITWIADCIYDALQCIDKSCYFAKLAKKSSKTFLRCAQIIEQGAIKDAKKDKCDIVVCGHIHDPCYSRKGRIEYYNVGCWVENPPTYLIVKDGKAELKEFCMVQK